MTDLFKSSADYVQLFHAVSLLLLAYYCIVGRGRLRHHIPFLWLGIFGSALSLLELLNLLAGSLGDAPAFADARGLLAAASFLLLLEFARVSTVSITNRGPGRWVLAPFALVALFGAKFGVSGFVAASCYLPGLVGGLWAGAMLLTGARKVSGESKSQLVSAGVTLMLYVIIAALSVPASAISFIDSERFLAVTGIPAQVIQAALALWLAISVAYFNKTEARIEKASADRHSLVPLAIILVILVTGWFLTDLVGRYGENGERKKLLSWTLTAASAIDPERVETLTGSPADIGKPEFERLRLQLQAIHAANPECRFVYLMGMKDDKMIFLADAEPSTSKDYSAPGDVYEDATAADIADYRAERSYIKDIYTDSWGTWVSGQTPIKTRDGKKLLGVIGMDINAANWIRTVKLYRLFCLAIAHFLCLLTLLFFVAWHRTKEAVTDAAALVERKNLEKQRADFSEMVTQDLRSPLSSIYGYTDMLLTDMKDELSEETVSVATDIQENCRKLVGMIDDFMTLSRLEYGGINLNKTLTDFGRLVKGAVTDASNRAKQKEVSVELDMPDGIPKTVIDRLQVERAISNLLQNAMEQSPRGGMVKVNARQTEVRGVKHLAVSVTDESAPIPESERDRVFEKFQVRKAGSVRRNGLALAIVKAVATAHNGWVEMEAGGQKGNTFTIYLPLDSLEGRQ